MQLYNTLTRKKEEFVPVRPGKVNMYVCGITAYDYCHIGHARSALVFDVLVRHLRALGLDVTFVRNFTDVDDKIIRRANEEKRDWREVGQTYIDAFHEDMDRLNVVRADHEPRATEYIQQMQDLCSELIAQGKAYAVPSGDVYFRVRAYPPYGKLSGRSLDELQAGARVAPGEEKQDPLDFALWKAAKPGEPFWESPWGKGRPGWHIECSAMSKEYLPLDIHGGGQDLIFPHHENEIAQTEAACSCQLARFWVHNGFVQVNAEKMSKSLGNFKTVRDLLQHYDGEVLRFLILSGQYRGPIDFNSEILEQSKNAMTRLRNAKSNLKHLIETGSGSMTDAEKEKLAGYDPYRQAFIDAMDDDLNTADAISAVFELVTAINTAVKDGASKEFAQKSLDTLMELANVLGFLQQTFEEEVVIDDELQALIDERQEARKTKNFARADEIRDELKARGLMLKDTPQGVQIIKA